MPTIHLPYINIALDAFGILVMFIILLSCIKEHIRNIHATSKSFTALLVFVIATLLVANIFFEYT